MPEILTESFCERCGTRYTFESAAPRAARLKGIKVLSRGLKNFVMSDDTSMDEAMAAARSETDREVTSQQLDAFHKTFNFCMTCRQYTCGNCWNEAEGRCLTCAPHLGHEILPAPFPDLGADGSVASGAAAVNGANGHAPAEPVDALAWPTMDLDRDQPEDVVETEPVEEVDALARLTALGAIDAATTSEAEAARAADTHDAEDAVETAEPVASAAEPVVDESTIDAVAAVAHPSAESSPVGDVDPGAVAASATDLESTDDPLVAAATNQTADLMHRFRPGQSLDAEIEAYERQQDEARAATEALAAAAALGRVDAADDAPTVDADTRPEPVVEATPVAETAPPVPQEPEPAPRDDVVEQPTWRIVAPDPETPAPDAPTTGPGPEVVPPVAATAEPEWPTAPEWPSQRQAAGGLPFLNRPAQPTGGMDALWAASASEVVNPSANAAARDAGGVQPCVSCGLSLSATARFCRRCGTRQG